MKKKLIAASSLAVAATLAFTSTPAFAEGFGDNLVINGISFQTEADPNSVNHVYEWDADNQSTLGDSGTHAAGELIFIDSTDIGSSIVCDTATSAIVEEADGDVVLTCDADALSGEFDGLAVSSEYRFYNLATPNVVMTRMLYSVSNTTGSDVSVPRMEVAYEWDEIDPTWNMLTNNGSVLEDTALAETGTRWLNTASYQDGNVNPDNTTFGAAWRADGNAYFTGYGNDVVSNDDLTPTSEDVVIPANSTVMVAFFAVYGSAGQGATTDETAAFMTSLDAQFAVFNEAFTSSSILAKGIAEGSNVLNWGVVAPAPVPVDPELAATGVDSATALGISLMAGLLLAAGAVLTLRRRA